MFTSFRDQTHTRTKKIRPKRFYEKTVMAQQKMTLPCDNSRGTELERLLESDSEEGDINHTVPVTASFSKFNASFEKDQQFWRNACETLDDSEYEKLVNANARDNLLKKRNHFDKFNEIFRQQSEFWSKASDTLDEDSFEKLVEEECWLEPFSQSVQMEIDFQPFLDLFKKNDNFWNVATKKLKDAEYEKLVMIYIASDNITWENLSIDVFNKKTDAGGKAAEEDSRPFVCDLCPKTFKISNQLRLHKEFNHRAQDRPLTCNFCSRQFKQFDALQKHRLMHTNP